MSLVNIAIWNINVAIWYYDKNIVLVSLFVRYLSVAINQLLLFGFEEPKGRYSIYLIKNNERREPKC